MASPPSHQKFVDDTLIFNHSSVKEAHSIKSILDSFSAASGSTSNLDKSLIFFFHTPLATQRNIKCIMGFSMGNIPFKYLGIPLSTSATKHSSWKTLLDEIKDRLNCWSFRPLNIAGKLVLLKSILQTLPSYPFSILATPKWVLKALINIQHNLL